MAVRRGRGPRGEPALSLVWPHPPEPLLRDGGVQSSEGLREGRTPAAPSVPSLQRWRCTHGIWAQALLFLKACRHHCWGPRACWARPTLGRGLFPVPLRSQPTSEQHWAAVGLPGPQPVSERKGHPRGTPGTQHGQGGRAALCPPRTPTALPGLPTCFSLSSRGAAPGRGSPRSFPSRPPSPGSCVDGAEVPEVSPGPASHCGSASCP